MTVWVRRPKSSLLEPVKVPEVTVEAAIERSWRVPEGGTLLELPEPEYLPTVVPVRPSWTPFPSPWEPIDYHPALIQGLPEV